MKRIVFDIETVGLPWEGFDEETQEYLLSRGKRGTDEESIKERLALYGPTGKVVAIGMMNPDTRKGGVYFEVPTGEPGEEAMEDDGVVFRWGSERDVLHMFWEDIGKYNHWVTFNGRQFDVPFLLQRSLILGVKPSRNLDSSRYSVKPHCDLMDILSLFGATRPFSLAFWCRTLGIKDPKGEGIDGSLIGQLYGEGRYRDIAQYCLKDVVATVELFRIVEERYLSLRSDWP